MNQPTGLNTAT